MVHFACLLARPVCQIRNRPFFSLGVGPIAGIANMQDNRARVLAMGKSSPMPLSRDVNVPIAIMATATLGLLSVAAIRMMWLGIYAAFGIDF